MTAGTDLTRWNRAGLRRLRYVDGNAVTHLERLRQALLDRFGGSGWTRLDPDGEVGGEATLRRYLDDESGDPVWEIARAFARAAHVVSEHVDAYANEAYLGTATQLLSLRRLLSLIDYQPAPASSATTPLAFTVEEGAAPPTVPRRTAIRYTPDDGAPVVFETLHPVVAHHELNALRHRAAADNPAVLTSPVTLEDDVPVRIGDPVVLESGGERAVRLVTAIDTDGGGRKVVELEGSAPEGFTVGRTVVRSNPQDRLELLGPREPTTGTLDGVLHLRSAPAGITRGDVVAIRTEVGSTVERNEFADVISVLTRGLRLSSSVSDLATEHTRVMKAVRIEIREVSGAQVTLAGDWGWLQGEKIAVRSEPLFGGLRLLSRGGFFGGFFLPMWAADPADQPLEAFTVTSTDEQRPATGTQGEPVTTVLTLEGTPSVEPNTLYAPAPGGFEAAIRVDAPLDLDALTVTTSVVTSTEASHHFVVADGQRLVVGRVTNARSDVGAAQASVTVDGWVHQGAGPLHVSTATAFGNFDASTNVHGWTRNPDPLSGHTSIPLAGHPPGLEPGRPVVVVHEPPEAEADLDAPEVAGLLTRVVAHLPDDSDSTLELADPLPEGTTADGVVVLGNVAEAGHGETRERVVLGSGAADRVHQEFLLPAQELATVPDPAFPTGSRPDVDVAVNGRIWKQVPTLQDSEHDDHHYLVRYDEEGAPVVMFGDGRRGRRLPTGIENVVATYRDGRGLEGNLPAESLDDPVRPLPRVDAVRQPLPASGGSGGESPDEVRDHAAASVLALDRAVTLDDFAALAARRADVWQAHALRRLPRGSRGEAAEVVVVPAGGRALEVRHGEAIAAALRAAAPPAVEVIVTGHRLVAFAVAMEVAVKPAAFEMEAVRQAVRGAVVDAFGVSRRRLGQSLYVTELLAVAETVEGVEHASCRIDTETIDAALLATGTPEVSRARFLDGEGSVRVAHARPDQVIALDPDAPGVTVVAKEFQP